MWKDVIDYAHTNTSTLSFLRYTVDSPPHEDLWATSPTVFFFLNHMCDFCPLSYLVYYQFPHFCFPFSSITEKCYFYTSKCKIVN